MSENTSDEWLSISDLAAALGVAKSTVSRRVAALEREDMVLTRQEGARKLIHRGSYQRGYETTVDEVQKRNGGARARGSDTVADADLVLGQQQARRTSIQADIAQMRLDEMRRNLLPASEVSEAMGRCAGELVRVLETMRTKVPDIAAMVAKEGEAGLKRYISELIREMRERLSAAMNALVADSAGEAVK